MVHVAFATVNGSNRVGKRSTHFGWEAGHNQKCMAHVTFASSAHMARTVSGRMLLLAPADLALLLEKAAFRCMTLFFQCNAFYKCLLNRVMLLEIVFAVALLE